LGWDASKNRDSAKVLKPVTARREANSKGTIYIRDNSISRNNENIMGVPAVRTPEQCMNFYGNSRKTL
jgi:hypothetical protein